MRFRKSLNSQDKEKEAELIRGNIRSSRNGIGCKLRVCACVKENEKEGTLDSLFQLKQLNPTLPMRKKGSNKLERKIGGVVYLGYPIR